MIRSFVLCICASALVAGSAHAQAGTSASQSAVTSPQVARAAVSDTLAPSPELQRALEDLAATLEQLGTRIANDPELRVAGVRVAQGMVGAAQLLVDVQTEVLRAVLQRAAERLATLPISETPR